jgi:hypothetical protein
MSASSLWVGPLGAMQQLDGVQAGRSVQAERPSSDLLTLGGARFVQVARRAPRTWQVSLSSWSSPVAAKWLTAAAQGLLGEVWLLDEASARANMLPPEFTAGRSGTQITVDGVPLYPLPAATVVIVPLRSGIQYRLTGVTTAAAAAVLGTTKLGAAAAVNVVAPAGVGARTFTATLVPGSDLLLTITVSSALVTGLRLAQAITGSTYADTSGWLPGEGTPCKVQVVDPGRTVQLITTTGHAVSDYTVTLREVGLAGVA